VNDLLAFDQKHIWHPYSSATQPSPTFLVERCEGVNIILQDGTSLIDGMSSWWCALHGYNNEALNQAAKAQLDKMSHVMFGGFTHEPAIELSRQLIELTPEPLQHVFLADSGSVAVEVALKMAIQYFASQGAPQKHRIMTIKKGYHGDTFGAMATCDPVTGMHHIFARSMPEHIFLDEPPQGIDAPLDAQLIASYEAAFAKHAHETAAFILEPIVQGAGGMRFYNPQYLRLLRELCDRYDLLLIADEIATGFGRTGKLFAVEHADISPDIMCLGKAITGGYMTLAATLCSTKVATTISNGEAGVFMHGPTFMGNPLACAVANANLKLLKEMDWQACVARISSQLATELAELNSFSSVKETRTLGAIGVIEMHEAVDLNDIQPELVKQGIWLRPFGKLIYMMPPFIISTDELSQLCQATISTIKKLYEA